MYAVTFLRELVSLDPITVIEETETEVKTPGDITYYKKGINSRIFEDFEVAKQFACIKMVPLISGIQSYLSALENDLENLKNMEKPLSEIVNEE